MSYYRTIDCRMWGDKKFRRLSPTKPSGQSLWQYILTGPHTTMLPGLWPFSDVDAADRLEWSLQPFRKRLRELSSLGMVEYASHAKVIWIPKSLKHNRPANPNVVQKWFTYIDPLPECDLKVKGTLAFAAHCEERGGKFLEQFRQPFGERFPEPLGEPIGESGTGSGTGSGTAEETPCSPPGGTSTQAGLSIQKPDPKSNTYTPDFRIMFDYFPNGKERREAFNEWKKVKARKGAHKGLPVPRVATVLQAIHWKCHGKKWTDEDGQFIESFRKFLRRRYWEDTPDDGQMNPIKEFEDYALKAYREMEEKEG